MCECGIMGILYAKTGYVLYFLLIRGGLAKRAFKNVKNIWVFWISRLATDGWLSETSFSDTTDAKKKL